jgi:hypothetical protein
MYAIHRKARALGLVAALGVAVTLSGCDDSTTAPAPQLQAVEAPAMPASLVTVEYMAEDSTSATFTVDYRGGTFQLGPHAIYFPRNAICEPSTSSYGLGEWDAPCTATKRTITIHAKIVHANGKQFIDFSPSLRFVPNMKGDKGVYLWMKVDPNYDPTTANPLNMMWLPAPGQEPIDESLSDPSLVTQYSAEYDVVYRRIKHFSGYMVAMD